jgi:hypothetical protein
MIGIRRFKRFYYTTNIRKSHSKKISRLLFRTFWRAESGSLALGMSQNRRTPLHRLFLAHNLTVAAPTAGRLVLQIPE